MEGSEMDELNEAIKEGITCLVSNLGRRPEHSEEPKYPQYRLRTTVLLLKH